VTALRRRLLQQWFGRETGRLSLGSCLRPLAALYGILQGLDRRRRERLARTLPQPMAPVVVVGNFVVGGAGKTPTTIALVHALVQAGWRPGVVSRGYGRSTDAGMAVDADADPRQVGDEPLLIHHRTGVPVHVDRDRRRAALALLQSHPQVDVIVADDGLQHRQLRRDVEVVVFDERGLGNGRLLPAGPLRERPGAEPEPQMLVLYNHERASAAWPGAIASRRIGLAQPLDAWLRGRGEEVQPLSALRGRPLLALAGIAVPERFFAALEAAGLQIERLPLPDHHDYEGAPPWPEGTREIVTTEKDAVKLRRHAAGPTKSWVVGLDLALPADFTAALLGRLARATARNARQASKIP
jgi:tetraacyldisaccharide 4'-kinase